MVQQRTLNEMLRSSVYKYSDETAIIYKDTKLSYQDLQDKVSRFSQGLISLGLRPNDKIAIMLSNCPEFFISFFAVARIGAIIVPLNIHFKENEIELYISDFRVKAIITDGSKVPLCKKIMAKRDMNIVLITRNKIDGVQSLGQIVEENQPIQEEFNIENKQDVMYQFSSGSTGNSKRIARTHYNLVREAENLTETVGLSNKDKVLSVVPLFHTYGLGNCLLAPVYAGGRIVILEEFRPRVVIGILQKEAITYFPAVPFMYGILAETLLDKEEVFSSLRLCISAGAPLPRTIFEKFHDKYHIYIRQQYGSTEMGAVAINIDQNISDLADSVGLPLRNVEVEIFNEDGHKIKDGNIGEIAVKSPAMTKEYFDSEALTKKCFKDGYFFTGDLGKKDGKGHLYITGRQKIFINTATHKVDPTEIENHLSTHPKISEVVVVGVRSQYGDEIVKAVIVPRSDCEEEEIINHCIGKIADFKLPRIIEFRKEIPRSPLGKVLKKYLC
ncbi:MAG: acyl--CoA ligase [Candidatus Scalindua sp.]|nr:acyl--CoA ligase [Candidatus Scalindua sp.]